MFAHCSNDQLEKLLVRGGCKNERLLKFVRQFRCQACDRMSRPKSHRKVAIPKATRPNQGVAIDAMFLYDNRELVEGIRFEKQRNYAVQNYLDLAATFHQAGSKETPEGTSWNCSDTRNAFDEIWVTPYGPPEFVLMDGGPENVGPEFREYCQYYGIQQNFIAAEAP